MTYYSLILLQKELLENQVFEEILRERSTYFFQQKKPRNFWIVFSPLFLYDSSWSKKLKKTQFLKKNNFENNFFLSIFSPDKDFINWVSLRLGYFENVEDHMTSFQKDEKDYVSNGIKLSFDEKIISSFSFLEGSPYSLDPEILLKKEKKFLLFLKQEQVFFQTKS